MKSQRSTKDGGGVSSPGWIYELESVSAPRCLFTSGEVTRSELHTVCDASQEAFAAVVYLRNTSVNGNVVVNFVMAKTKLAPLKTISVARLELQAALLGTRLASYVERAFRRPIHGRRFWTDSSCVCNWIRSPASYYKPYVSHHIGEIQTTMTPSEWRYLPGRLNVCDNAMRWAMKPGAPIDQAWFSGPRFLREAEETWPKDLPWIVNAEEMRSVNVGQTLHVVTEPTNDSSSLDDLDPEETIGFTRIDGKLLTVLKGVQEKEFCEEIKRLKAGRDLRRSSKLLSFTPFLDSSRLMTGGRLSQAPLPYENRHPVLLPSGHSVSRRIVEEFHR